MGEAKPQYTDLTGNGIEDAAVMLQTASGNGYWETWYFWIWRDGEPEQLRQAAAMYSDCGNQVDSLTPVDGGFTVEARLREPDQACVEEAAKPISYTIGLYEGYPATLEPTVATPLPCGEIGQRLVRGKLSPRLAPDP